jgi:micrococcal nuclease
MIDTLKERFIERIALLGLFVLMCAARCAAQTDSIVPPTLSGGWIKVPACYPHCPGAENYAALDGFVLGGTLLASKDTIQPPTSVIRRVFDGDSYEFAGLMPEGKAGREEGIDAPEKQNIYVSAAQPYGQQAADSVRAIIRGKAITYTVYGVDRYNRPRVSVYIDGQSIAEVALARGWAWYYSPNKLPSAVKKRYKDLERSAKKKKLGLWASANPVRPSAWRKAHPMPK